MRLHKLRRRQSHPLIERYIGEVITLEDFEKAHRRVAGILDVMAHGKGNETDIAGAEVEGARLTRSAEHAHACLALDVILPLVDRKSTRLNSSHSQISYAVVCL